MTGFSRAILTSPFASLANLVSAIGRTGARSGTSLPRVFDCLCMLRTAHDDRCWLGMADLVFLAAEAHIVTRWGIDAAGRRKICQAVQLDPRFLENGRAIMGSDYVYGTTLTLPARRDASA